MKRPQGFWSGAGWGMPLMTLPVALEDQPSGTLFPALPYRQNSLMVSTNFTANASGLRAPPPGELEEQQPVPRKRCAVPAWVQLSEPKFSRLQGY